MKLLLDSHLLVWLAAATAKLPPAARTFIEDPQNTLFFSTASVWELMVKYSLGKNDIPVHPRVLHRALLDNGFTELPIDSVHAFNIESLPPIHKDPFDRILIAQALAEGMLLLTSDEAIARYSGPIRLVR
ncbi:type II toxin-antitoxin system VapC family toxin [Rhizobium deserti]|uniref:Type II toxin-antitoxin system VapC family toxin n=1 Tax=Rhizobium deserti TaxID=2547961 RepID=A0A4R5UHJ9_9HYPH|nr:type II toxin-antitoxin system VapC family toxin [Rhizobium deserti]TDK35332.1 type II toxin-antitoxin system VapC family toxin [Rhizobium deserti]